MVTKIAIGQCRVSKGDTREIENSLIGGKDFYWDDSENLYYCKITVKNATHQDFENVVLKISAGGYENTYTIDKWRAKGDLNIDIYRGNDIAADGSVGVSYYFDSYQYKSYTYSNN